MEPIKTVMLLQPIRLVLCERRQVEYQTYYQSLDSWVQNIPKKGNLEARGSKWFEQTICQCTQDQATGGITDQVASPVKVFESGKSTA